MVAAYTAKQEKRVVKNCFKNKCICMWVDFRRRIKK